MYTQPTETCGRENKMGRVSKNDFVPEDVRAWVVPGVLIDRPGRIWYDLDVFGIFHIPSDVERRWNRDKTPKCSVPISLGWNGDGTGVSTAMGCHLVAARMYPPVSLFPHGLHRGYNSTKFEDSYPLQCYEKNAMVRPLVDGVVNGPTAQDTQKHEHPPALSPRPSTRNH